MDQLLQILLNIAYELGALARELLRMAQPWLLKLTTITALVAGRLMRSVSRLVLRF